MTTLLKSMIAHYKDTGSRVDEVLFQEVMKVVERVQEVEGFLSEYQKDWTVLIPELKRVALENRSLREQIKVFEMKYENTGSIFNRNHQIKRIESAEAALEFYAADMTYQLREDKKGQLYTDIEKDRGRRALMYLRRESRAGGKNKGAK